MITAIKDLVGEYVIPMKAKVEYTVDVSKLEPPFRSICNKKIKKTLKAGVRLITIS